MITPAKFKYLQTLFFNKVTKCCNPSTITVKMIKTQSTGSYTDFTGDSTRLVDKEFELSCFYMRNISDKVRERTGVSQDTTDIVYISPLELEKKFGINKFPNYVINSLSQIEVRFLNKHYELLKIVDLEPMQNGNEFMCLAYQLNLRGGIGNKDFN